MTFEYPAEVVSKRVANKEAMEKKLAAYEQAIISIRLNNNSYENYDSDIGNALKVLDDKLAKIRAK